jgi:type II secretory pathway component HofQ
MALAVGCGDFDFVFAVRTGTVADDAACSGTGGSFGLRDQQGLTVLIVITEDTEVFFASGGRATCGDITKGVGAEVRGDNEDGTIAAQSVRLGGGPSSIGTLALDRDVRLRGDDEGLSARGKRDAS